MNLTNRFIAEREYAARPEDLFAAWADVAILTRWFGCGNDMLWTVHAWEVREGGAIAVSLDFDGEQYDVRGEFLIVEPPRRLRYRWNGDQTVDVTIEPHASGSLLRLEHAWPPTDEDRSMLAAGWTNALEQLALALSQAGVS